VTGVPYLDLSAADSQSITNLRFRYADEAVSTPAGGRLDVWDSQFFQCDAAVVNWFGGVDSLHNVLIAGCYDAVAAFTNNFTIAAEQVTAEVSNFWDAGVSPSHFSLTNSIVLGNVVSATSQNTSINPDPANFEINGAGNYYLAAGSTLHQTGSTNVSPYLLNEFHNKTTYAPIAMPAMMSLSGNLTFAPQTPRYTNGPPDKGYYYDALDYTVARLINFGSITVEPGTVIGFREDTNADSFWGFDLRENSSFAGHGTPNQPIVLADVQMVQEQLEYPCYADFVPDFEGMPDVPGPVMDFRFCNFYPAVGWYHVWAGLDYLWDFMPSFNSVVNWTLRDCNLHGGQINLGEPDCGGLPGYSGFYGIPYNTIYGSGAVTWNNNLFDNVQINLQPTYDWFDGTINVDLAFQAENNLFRHGDIFTLVPVPASAGNWTFKDNLFDKVEFSQGTAMPLDFDYNGYWALTASEVQWNVDASQLLATTTGDGTTDGLNEVLLDYAPPYASGPFGDYYLTTLTPLYQAGSRSAGDAGLGQYTTFTNQVKDATNQPVNIGLHYVAAPSSYLLTSNSCPLDSDGDGISDYVEVEHGTDPNNPMTDGVTPDAYNAVYDDVDLDGDGLTGLMERFLGTDPLTADNPLKLPPVQSVSGFIDLPLASLPTVISNAALRVYLNGQESANCNLYQATDGGWHLQLDSLTVPNGGSMLQLGLSYGEDMDQLQTVFGSTCLLQVTNAITVDPLTMMFTDALHIEAGVNVAADNYEIDIYDISNNLLKTLTGTVQTNWISAGWDLTDTNGDVIVTGPLRCDFYLTSAAAAAATANAARSQAANAASGSAASVHYRLTKHIGGKSFAVAFAGFKFPNAQDVVSENVVDVLCAGEGLSSLDYNLLPNQAVNTPHADNAFEWYGGTNGNKSTLTDALLNGSCGNFYWMGHGNTTVISPTTNLVSTERITTTELQPALGNQGYIGTNTFANNHPYRLVILDGCNTYSWPWAKTWGIPWFGEDVKDHYISEGLDVCAFVGWTKTTYTSYSNNGGEAYGRCQRELFANWYAGFTLKQCLNFYNQALTNELNKPYLPATNNFNSWKIAGCSDLRTSDR